MSETLLEEGVVVLVMPATGHARVHLVAGDHCEGCPANAICKPDRDDRRVMDVRDPLGVAVGDRVRIAVPGGAVLHATFLVYGLPLLLLLAGVWLGTLIWPAENHYRDLFSFLLGAGLAGAAVPVVARMVRGGQVLEPSIEAKIAESAA